LRLASQPAAPTLTHVQLPDLGSTDGSRLNKLLILAGLVLLLLSVAWRYTLPHPDQLRPELHFEPEQTPVTQPPFDVRVGDVTYSVQPLAEYEIWGLVVSGHDTRSWWNWIHDAWNDHLNVMDLCVVFAENVTTGAYVGLDYSSGQFVCYVQTNSSEKWQRFSMRALANNHLLADHPAVVRELRNVRVGDQIRIRGWLAEYSHNHGLEFKRGTSLTREDSGNGACETIYVKDIEVLQAGGGPWHVLLWVGALMCAVGSILWLRAPFKVQ